MVPIVFFGLLTLKNQNHQAQKGKSQKLFKPGNYELFCDPRTMQNLNYIANKIKNTTIKVNNAIASVNANPKIL